jgi:superfamily II RNA helicase
MVKICSLTSYPKDNENEYKEYFEKYPYELSIFQKYAIEGIVKGNHILITAHTGSGKTLPAEFAIEYFVSKGKKVIYTGPIKSLINQKFYDFTHKYPHISFGILTGDIKCNPEADVLIVTAEILLNKLYQMNSVSQTQTQSSNNISFEMDFQNELACVVMDEVHYINEEERGHVWESTLMMLPPHVQLVMLSATIDKPEMFAHWCENMCKEKQSGKEVYLTNTNFRVVPLTHYSFITVNQGIFKAIKDKSVHEEIKRVINKPFVIQDSNGKFNDETYYKVDKMLKLFEHHDIRIKRAHVLNEVTKYLVEQEMLPALCFVLSRKQLEICAKEITTNLLEFDSKVPYIIDRECEQIIRKLPNYKEYLHLPEYVNMVALLRKGIAIHHSGVMPVLKEIVELLYAKGYIKLLFATETFSIGVNMPTKTVIFTDVNKFDGSQNRILYSHEMMQMAGRAGRRGIDKVGNCFHLNNLFRNVDSVNYKRMMAGKPQTLTSKFKISFHLLLNLFSIGNQNAEQFAAKSMVTVDLDAQKGEIYNKIQKINAEMDTIQQSQHCVKTPTDVIQEYIELKKKLPQLVNKKRKEAERGIQKIADQYKTIEHDKKHYEKYFVKQQETVELQHQLENTDGYIRGGIDNVLTILKNNAFITKNEDGKYCLTLKGQIASQLKETHCLVFANLIENGIIDTLTSKQLVCLFSCFTNVNVKEDAKENNLEKLGDNVLKQVVEKTTKMYNQIQDEELQYSVNTGTDYSYHYDLLRYVDEWCVCENVEDCKIILQKISLEKDIFLGEFVKAILKINNISCELEKIAEMIGQISLLSKLREISQMTMKFVVTNQSLYI